MEDGEVLFWTEEQWWKMTNEHPLMMQETSLNAIALRTSTLTENLAEIRKALNPNSPSSRARDTFQEAR